MRYRIFLLLAVAFGCQPAVAQVRIGLMVSATGPTAAIGIPQKNTGALLATRVGETTIDYIQLDAGLLLQRAIPIALKAAKPGTETFRIALRDALEQQQGVVGCQGVFNMSPGNHNGMDERARVLVVVKDGRFRLLAQ